MGRGRFVTGMAERIAYALECATGVVVRIPNRAEGTERWAALDLSRYRNDSASKSVPSARVYNLHVLPSSGAEAVFQESASNR